MMKRKLLLLFTMIFALIGVVAGAVACRTDNPEEKPIPGAEKGEYYCTVGDAEYTLSLSDECKVTLVMGGETFSGSYVPSGPQLALTFDSGETASADYADDVVTLAFRDVSYRFLRKINYTVTFETNGGSSVEQVSVLNGKTLAKPEAPAKSGSVFVGWYTDAAFKNLYNFNRPVTSDLKLFARFVEETEGIEFTVSFDLGYEGATAIPDMQTIGGVAYALPQPERADAEFVGWWVSHYNAADKLTYRYNEQKLTDNTTLFAVWKSDAPVVSVEPGNVVWSADGTNNSYTVVVTDAQGAELYRRTSGATSLAADQFDFAAQPAGEYVVSVTLGEQTTSAYYKNKALARPMNLRVEESTLMFNPVEGATDYTLTLVCGSPDHDHTAIELGNKTSYDFSACEMPEGGFRFTVAAAAEDRISSVSDTLVFTRTLDGVKEILFDKASDAVSWEAVEHATSYYLTLSADGKELFAANLGDHCSFDLQSYGAGNYTVSVYPVARGWFSPAATSAAYSKARLATPVGLSLDGYDIVWSPVADAAKYRVKIGETVYECETNRFSFTDAQRVAGQTEYVISVSAVGDAVGSDSLFSVPVTAHDGVMTDSLVYEESVLSWEPVIGATNYLVTVNGKEFSVEKAHSLKITLTQKGENILTVKAVLESGAESEAFSRTVNAFALAFDAQFGEEVPTLYLAKGDPIPEIETERFGFSFVGWYDVPGGPQENGERFNDAFYSHDNDLTLYAVWQANKYKAILNAGAYGEEVAEQEIDFNSEFTLPVPAAKSEEYAFAGWYTQPNGNGTQYADFDGNGLKSWTDTDPRTLYAFWVEIFSFSHVTGGYAVSKGPGIGYVSEVTAPQTHAGEPVVAISDFSSTATLLVFNFYDTVETLTVGSVGIAFDNCANLEAINVIHAEGTHEPRFWSEDGVLLGNNETTGDVELYLYPLRHKLVDNTYTIPESVTRLSEGMFYANSSSTAQDQEWTLRKLVVPASVTYVGVGALSQITTVREIEFLDPADGSAGKELVIEDGAFHVNWGLKTVKLPARLAANFSGGAFIDESGNDLQNLAEVTVPDNAKYYTMVGGLLCRKTEGNGAELVYYPLPHRDENSSNFVYQTEIVIPDGVTSIASNAIPMDNSSVVNAITKIEIAHTVTNIAPHAFDAKAHGKAEGFKNVKELIFHSTRDDLDLTIGESAFYRFSASGFHTVIGHADGSVTEGAENVIELPENLVSLGSYAFGYYNTNVKTVIVNCGGEGRTLDFKPNAFASNEGTSKTSNIEVVNLGADAVGIDLAAVFGSKLKEVNVPENSSEYNNVDGVLFNKDMTKILFYPANGVDNFTVPDTITAIGDNLFAGRSLKEISLPATLCSIGSSAFMSCKTLQTITFREVLDEGSSEKGLTVATDLIIGDNAFNGCSALTELSLPKRTSSVGESAFRACSALNSVALNEGLKTIGKEAFYGDAKLTAITIPASVEELGVSNTSAGTFASKSLYVDGLMVFRDCTLLASIEVAQGNERYASVDGVLYEKEEGVLSKLLYCPVSKDGVLQVPATVTHICPYALYSNGRNGSSGGVTEIQFAEGTYDLTIDPESIYYAYRLKTVNLPVGTKEIGEFAFSSSTALTSIFVPNTVTRIGAKAFVGCSNLTDLQFEKGGETELVLEGGYSTTTSSPSSGDYMFYNTKLATVELPDRVKEIQPFLFSSMNSLTSIKIPASVKVIDVGAFYGCSALASVEFAENGDLEEIGLRAFYNVRTVGELKLPASVKTIGKEAFYAGTSSGTFYTSIQLNEGLETIGEGAFKCALNLTELTIPSTVKRIEKEAFGSSNTSYNLKALQTVNFAPKSQIEYIGENAFGNDIALKTVNFNDPVGPFEIGTHAFASCTALAEISLPSNVKIVGEGAFLGCSALETVTFAEGTTKLETVGTNAFQAAQIAEIAFPESENGIELGKNIFNNNKVDLTVHLSASVKYLNGSFGNCTLAALTVDDDSPYFKLKDSVLYDADGSIMLVVGELEGEVVIELGAIEIAAGTFAGQTGITSVYIPASVQTIGANAFNGCTGLKTVTFQTSSALTAIGALAFNGCTELTSINLQATSHLNHLGASAFAGCSALETVDLSRNTDLLILGANTGISSGNGAAGSAFKGTTSLKTVKLPKSINTLGTSGFENSGISEIDLSALTDLVQIAGSAGTASASGSTAYNTFKGCKNLVTVKLPTSVIAVGANAFQDCTALKEINLDNVVTIGQFAFSNCGFETLNLPVLIVEGRLSTTTSHSNMGKNAFEKNTKLTRLNIPEGVNSLGAYAFTGCTALETLDFPESFVMTNLDGSNSLSYEAYYHMFDGCTSLQTVTFKSAVETLPRYMFANCGKLTTINLPGAQVIDQYAFENCTSLNAFTVGANTDEVAANAFKGCSALATLTVQAEEVTFGNNAFQNTALSKVNFPADTSKMTFGNYVFDGCNFTSFEVPNAASIGTYFLSNNENLSQVNFANDFALAELPGHMFDGCTQLASVPLPTCVTSLGAYALANTGLVTYEVPAQITTVGEHAFFNCTQLTTVTFAASDKIAKLGNYAFACDASHTSKLASITLPESVTELGTYCFQYSGLTSIKLPSKLATIGMYAFANCTKLASVDFNGNTTLKGIGTRVFEYCSALTAITLPDSLEYVGQYTFQYSGLKSIDLSKYGNKMKYLGSTSATSAPTSTSGHVFYHCEDLTEVILPEGLTHIAAYCFSGCTSLEEINLPNSITYIGKEAFSGSALKSVDLSELSGLKFIGAGSSATGAPTISSSNGYTFANCENLATVKLPSAATHIAAYVFQNCTALESIEIPASVTLIGNYAFAGSGLKHFEFPAALATLGTNVFNGCKSLKQVYIPSTIKVAKTTSGFASTVFAGCSDYTIYTDGEAEQLKTDYAALKDAAVTGKTTLEDYKKLLG